MPLGPRHGYLYAVSPLKICTPRRGVHILRGETAHKYPLGILQTYPPDGVQGLSGPLLPQSPFEKVGGEAPHRFQ